MKYRINKKWTPHAVITAVAMDVVITLMERTREEAVECAREPVAKKASRRAGGPKMKKRKSKRTPHPNNPVKTCGSFGSLGERCVLELRCDPMCDQDGSEDQKVRRSR